MFEKKKKATKKNEDLMKKAPSSGAVELGDDVLEAAAGGYTIKPMPIICDGFGVRGKDGEPRVTDVVLWGADGTLVDLFSSRADAEAYAKEHGIE